MKKKLFAAILMLAMCFALTACGSGDGGGDSGKTKEAEKEAAREQTTSIVGTWECEAIEMTDNGDTLSGEEIKNLFGDDLSSMMKLVVYGDGTAEITVMDDDPGMATWTEKDGTYTFTAADGSDEEDALTARLEDEKLRVTITETYSADGEDQTMETTFVLKYLGKNSKILEGWDIQLSDDEVYAMSNFMNNGIAVAADGMLYGDFGGKEFGKGAFTVASIKGEKLGDQKVIVENTRAEYLTELDGTVYAQLDQSKLVSVKVGESRAKTLYEGDCDYMQVTGDGIYFTDEKNRYCMVDLDGKNKETLLDKEVYYPYLIGANFVIYQDDADGESLHMYNLESKTDVKLNNEVSYAPMICGDYVYYQIPSEGDDEYYVGRIDLYSGKAEKSEKDMILYTMYVEPADIVFSCGGFTALEMKEWDQLPNKSYGGENAYTKYSDGRIWITSYYGERFMEEARFGTGEQSSMGYSYVKE